MTRGRNGGSGELRPLDGGARARLVGVARSPASAWTSQHEALIAVNPATGRYERSVTGAGRGMLAAPHKRFSCSPLVDRDGGAWKFPHQHALHCGQKIDSPRFAVGAVGGFFEADLHPVVTVEEATLAPRWQICEMHHDLHCGTRTPQPIAPGTTHRWRGRIQSWDRRQAAAVSRGARLLAVTASAGAGNGMRGRIFSQVGDRPAVQAIQSPLSNPSRAARALTGARQLASRVNSVFSRQNKQFYGKSGGPKKS